MTKIKPSNLTIWTELFQFASIMILTYKIIGKNTLTTEWHDETFYILECQSCSDHEKCKVAVKFNDFWKLSYSHMLNNYQYDNEYFEENWHHKNDQEYWHKWENLYFFLTRKEAQVHIHELNIEYLEKEISKNEEKNEKMKKDIQKYQEQIKILNEK